QDEAMATLRIGSRIGVGLLALTGLWLLVAAVGSPTPPASVATPAAQRALRAALNHDAYIKGVLRFGFFLAVCATGVWLWVRGSRASRTPAIPLAVVTAADPWIIDDKCLQVIPAPNVSPAADDVAKFLAQQPKPFRTFVLFDLPQDTYLLQFGIEPAGGLHP